MGSFAPFGRNMRRFEIGQVGPRPPVGDALFTGGSGSINSLRRLNDSTPLGPVAGYSIVYDIGSDLYVGNALVESGFSTKRKTYASFRPDASVQPWMYVGDSLKGVKVNANGTVWNTGIAEPQTPADTELSGNQFCEYFTGQGVTFGIPFGTGAAPGGGGGGPFNAYSAVLWNYGDQGACSIVVSTANMFANSVLLIGGGAHVGINALLAAPTNTFLTGFTFDNPVTGGPALVRIDTAGTIVDGSIYLTPAGKYLHVIGSPWTFGTETFFRTYVPLADAPTVVSALVGVAGIRAFSPINIPQSGTLFAIPGQQVVTAGTGGIFQTAIEENSDMEGRLIQDTDRVRIIIKVDVPANVTNCKIYFNLDQQTNDFTQNALVWTISGASFTSAAYLNLSTLVSSLARVGTNIALNLATGVSAIKIEWTVTGNITYAVQSLGVIGNYGPTGSGSNAPLSYRYIYRSSFLGSKSNPSPPQRTSINPTAQGVWVHPSDIALPADIQVDVLDWYRIGGTLLNYTYVGTANIIDGVIEPFLDDNDDLAVANNPLLEFDNFEPFPSIDIPHNGEVVVNGFNIIWDSGDQFDTRWSPGSQITIAGRVFTLYNRPPNATHLTVLENGGTQGASGNGVPYSSPRPTLLAQRLPALWGPTDNTGFFFAVGDPLRPGTLYFTKGNNPDSAPDTNQIEVTSPSEPLINGCILNGLGMVFSTERAWWIYPQFANVLATVIGTVGSPFYLIETISNRGLFAKNGICTDGGGRVFFVSKDGIYESAGGPGKCITDEIYTMFPHEGGPQVGMAINGTIMDFPDYSNPDSMALAFVDGRLYFDYLSRGVALTLVYDVQTGMWSQDISGITGVFTAHAPNEGEAFGTLIGLSGIPHATIRTFDPLGTEPVTMVIQPDFSSMGNPAWQHIKELNAEYQLPSGAANLQFIPDQGTAIASISIPIAAKQIKSLLVAPANKWKLLQYILVVTDNQFRIWVDGTEVKIGAWGRTDPYRVIKPFLRFGVNVASD